MMFPLLYEVRYEKSNPAVDLICPHPYMIRLIILMGLLSLVPAAAADDYLQINGRSIHFGGKILNPNENNTGVGWERESVDLLTNEVTGVMVGTLINSVNDRSYYLGGSYRYKIDYLEVGAVGGLIYYKSSHGNLWPAILPEVSFRFKHFGINATYIPALRNDVVPALLFQLVIKL